MSRRPAPIDTTRDEGSNSPVSTPRRSARLNPFGGSQPLDLESGNRRPPPINTARGDGLNSAISTPRRSARLNPFGSQPSNLESGMAPNRRPRGEGSNSAVSTPRPSARLQPQTQESAAPNPSSPVLEKETQARQHPRESGTRASTRLTSNRNAAEQVFPTPGPSIMSPSPDPDNVNQPISRASSHATAIAAQNGDTNGPAPNPAGTAPGSPTQEPEQCVICLESLTGQVRNCRQCHHAFHIDCLQNWHRTQAGGRMLPTCPHCRSHMPPDSGQDPDLTAPTEQPPRAAPRSPRQEPGPGQCTHCRGSLAGNDITHCMDCHRPFHYDCLLRPISLTPASRSRLGFTHRVYVPADGEASPMDIDPMHRPTRPRPGIPQTIPVVPRESRPQPQQRLPRIPLQPPQPGYTADGRVIRCARNGRVVVQEEDGRLSLCTAREVGGSSVVDAALTAPGVRRIETDGWREMRAADDVDDPHISWAVAGKWDPFSQRLPEVICCVVYRHEGQDIEKIGARSNVKIVFGAEGERMIARSLSDEHAETVEEALELLHGVTHQERVDHWRANPRIPGQRRR
ncbi:hypothetical protein EMCG_05074 [[Emmonsia] crescens]|uniref:RING-type domain-containing protein n=1 Tax=[Emmonsia] crescens TaxID=73230 RepID=A0A0G2HPY4_9EURO|nr:hypothetical protein EMCG_05074 [Emmonsia crescens UAMH 3008]